MNSAGIAAEGIFRSVLAVLAAITVAAALLLQLHIARPHWRLRGWAMEALVRGVWHGGLLSIGMELIHTLAFGVVNVITGRLIVYTSLGILLFTSAGWMLGFWFGFGTLSSQPQRQTTDQPVKVRAVMGCMIAGAIAGSSLQTSANAAVMAVRIIAISFVWGIVPLLLPYSRFANRVLSEKPQIVVISLGVIGVILLVTALGL
jgi:hypothetical protein